MNTGNKFIQRKDVITDPDHFLLGEHDCKVHVWTVVIFIHRKIDIENSVSPNVPYYSDSQRNWILDQITKRYTTVIQLCICNFVNDGEGDIITWGKNQYDLITVKVYLSEGDFLAASAISQPLFDKYI